MISQTIPQAGLPSAEPHVHRQDAGWLYSFLLLQFTCQVALIAPLGSARILFRMATFGSSICFLFLPAAGKPIPGQLAALAIIGLTAFGILNPQSNTLAASLGQVGLTLAIWGPFLWVPRIRISPRVFRKAIFLVWIFNTLSASVGVLQVYDPDRFMPDPQFVIQMNGSNAESLKIALDGGEKIWRPMGLTDTPGGAASSGYLSLIAGLVLVNAERKLWLRIAGAGSMLIGFFCVYLCQVRSTVVLSAIAIVVLVGLEAMRGRGKHAIIVGGVAAAAIVAAFLWATSVGSEAVVSRLESLTEGSAGQVYYQNRGVFVEHTFDLLSEYPLGAGLGRWGMMMSYFGNKADPDSFPLWAEIQLTAWLYDGGILLLAAGMLAVGLAIARSIQAASLAWNPIVAEYAPLVVALNVAVAANLFSYAVFASQTGMMCWVVTAALYTASTFDPIRPPS